MELDGGIASSSMGNFLDKGYQDVPNFRAITPKKKKHGLLVTTERQRNKNIATDRFFVEHFVGQEIKLWAILDDRFKLAKEMYDTIVLFCRSLTNFHIVRHGLQAENAT